MEKVLVPEKVYRAFENTKRAMSHIDSDQLNVLFLNIFTVGNAGDLKILKEYAKQNPTKYLKCLVYGYTLDKQEVLKNMIHDWLESPIADNDEMKDIEIFAERLTQFFYHNS